MVITRPTGSSVRPEVAASSSVVVNNGSREVQKKERGLAPTPVAFLPHNASLCSVFERFGEENVLKGWSEEDCAGLLVQVLKNSCDTDGAKRIVRCFRETSVDEVVECFNICKDLNQRALKERVRMENCESVVPLPERVSRFQNWSSVLTHAKKSRGIPDDSSAVIAKLLTEMSDKSEDNEKKGKSAEPNYKFIYNHLASLMRGYAMRDARSIDAAVILEIFESMENIIGSMPRLRAFFAQMFKDIQHFPNDEFKLSEELNDANSGRLLTNILEMPDDFFDLSKMCDDNLNNKM